MTGKVKVSIVVAAAENNVIGFEGDMPWSLSTDLKRFKALTLGKPMVMGRKTFEAIGKPLPGRTSVIVTRDKQWQSPGVVPVQTIEQALELARQIATDSGAGEICIVGGGEIYRQTMDIADEIHLTRVHADPQGDTYFPDISGTEWKEVNREDVPAGERDTAQTTYLVYKRKVRH